MMTGMYGYDLLINGDDETRINKLINQETNQSSEKIETNKGQF